jgi:hypothetical protein
MSTKPKRTPEVVEEILRRMSDGEPLRQILRSDEKFPCHTVWGDWCRADAELQAAHYRARYDGFDAIAHRTRETARGVGDSSGEVARDKLIIETDLKLLAKWDRRRYGESLAIGGADDLPPIKTITDEQLEARIKALQAQVNGKPS